MITELRVRDLATIADVTLPLGPGLNVLTGETGAGKSMIVDGLALILGARADAGTVRPGAARAIAEAAFEPVPAAARGLLDDLGLEADEDRLVIRREVSGEGRSRAWVNGSATTVGVLAALGRLLVDLHGQHETQTLLQPERQRDVLDAFADAEADAAGVRAAAEHRAELVRQESELRARREEVRRRADYLRFVADEIESARLKPGEDEALDVEARRLGQAESLRELAQRIAGALEGEDGAALTALARADRAVAALERADPAAAPWRDLLDGAFAQVQELARLALEYAGGLDDDPSRLTEVERRRDQLYRLKQKHGATLEEVLAAGRRARDELDLLDRAEFDLRAIGEACAAADADLHRRAAILSTRREAAAERLGRSVNRLLPRLGLPGGKLLVRLTALEVVSASGAEQVEFLVQLNQGHEPRPLAKTASGGELSRLMLALKTVLGRHDQVPTLVFDEVDQGIGGEIGRQVGETLAEVAARHQVLVITHLAPIAARAERHLAVAKRARSGVATSDVEVLHGEDRVNELARMLGDADSETARRHALELLK
ncbi:MAG TPA: DNA repair protein RecN [Gemmatimonadales bacterium]